MAANLADVPSRLTEIQKDNRAHDAEILSRVAALRQRVFALEDTVEKIHVGFDTAARVLTEDLEQTKAGVSAIQGNAAETLSHMLVAHQRVANSAEEIVQTKNGVSALQDEVTEIRSHVASTRNGVSVLQGEVSATKNGVSAAQALLGDIASEVTALRREVAALKEHETDYQLLMIRQQQRAELRDLDPDFIAPYEACRRFTMTSLERLYSLYKSVSYIASSGIPGDLAECGVWRGGSCMLMALGLVRERESARKIYMFDTFEGHPRPDPERDLDLWGNRGIDEWRRREQEGSVNGWGSASLSEVHANLLSTGYPESGLVFVKGMVEATVPENVPEALALLRLDTDWYEPTRVALKYLYPRLVDGGVLIVDDYGHYQGQRRAVDEYFAEIGETPLLHRVDYSCRIMMKRSGR